MISFHTQEVASSIFFSLSLEWPTQPYHPQSELKHMMMQITKKANRGV